LLLNLCIIQEMIEMVYVHLIMDQIIISHFEIAHFILFHLFVIVANLSHRKICSSNISIILMHVLTFSILIA